MESFAHPFSQSIREIALALPETSEGTSCVNRAFKVRKKNFLFLGEKDGQIKLMLKLVASADEARALADPRVSIGGIGWVTMRFDPEDPLDEALLRRWILESFRANAPKTVARLLD